MNENPPPPPGLTPEQKRVVVILAGLAAVLFVVLVVALLVRDDPDDSIVADATTTTTIPAEETSTTVDLPSSTTAAPTTTTRPTTTTSTTAAPRPVIDGRGAVLAPPSTATRREVSGSSSFCDALADPGWTAECGAFKGRDKAELAWVVERKDGGLRARVFRHGQGRQWSAVLEARDDTGSRFSDVNVRVIDLSGDGTDEAVFGFHQQGTAEVLSVDVVEGPGAVVVHRDSPKGSARLSTGQLDLWEAAGNQYDHLTIRLSQGAWRIVANVKVSPSDVPPSQL